MMRHLFMGAAAILLASLPAHPDARTERPRGAARPAPKAVSEALPAAAESSLDVAAMSLDDKLAQVFLAAWPQWALPDAWRAVLKDGGIGGVMLSPGENYLLPEELDALTAAARDANAAPAPLLFAAPCEGGTRALLSPCFGGASVPEAAALGARGDAAAIRDAYSRLASDFAVHGIHLAFGPVLGLTGPNATLNAECRSFGTDPARVAEYVAAAVAGIERAHVLCAPQSFPGLPDLLKPTGLDTTVAAAQAALADAAVKAGASAMGAGAVRVPSWDVEPVDVYASAAGLGEHLRAATGFQGLLISPNLAEGETLGNFSAERTCVMALTAGCDLLYLRAADPGELALRKQALRDALDSGALPAARLDEAVRHVLAAKNKAGAGKAPAITVPTAPDAGNAQNGVVIVRDSNRLLPLRSVGTRYLVVSPGVEIREKDQALRFVGTTLGAAIRNVVPDATECRISLDPTTAQHESALAQAADADVLILGVLLAQSHPPQEKLITSLLALGKPAVIISLGDPEGLEPFVDAAALVTANGYSLPALRGAAAVLFGEQKAGGRLPAPIGRLYPTGHAVP